MIDILGRLRGVKRSGTGWAAQCPCPEHRDKNASLSVAHGDKGWVLFCHAGCAFDDIVTALGVKPADLFDDGGGRGGFSSPSKNRATVQPLRSGLGANAVGDPPVDDRGGLTLERYAKVKALPVEFLKGCGLSEISYDRLPCVRIPYYGTSGEEQAVRFRPALEGNNRFRWKSGDKPCLYGLQHLPTAQTSGYVVLVEGESDTHTLWFHRIPALGIPGATNWREDRDARHFDGIETIYVVIEPDRGGDQVKKWLAVSAIRHRVKLVTLSVKDPSALHLQNPDEFPRNWQVACLGAIPWSAVEADANAVERSEAWEQCSALARSSNILNALEQDLSKLGLVGERRAAKLIYLVITSRLLDRPVSAAVKGPSSGGKSFVVEIVLKFFPASAFYALSAMSDRLLVYSDEPLRHRTLVIYEAAGMASDIASYLIRTLLSEGRLRYATVEKTKDGLVARMIEREGPTGLLVTTTSLRLHPENETRMLTLTITDTQVQTAAVFQALAKEGTQAGADLSRWHALQTWLSTEPAQVSIPYAYALAEMVPPIAIRLRRDFKTILMLIRSHCLLHQASRLKDERGRVVATLDDYAAVRELVADLVAEGIEATVRPQIREVVEATARLIDDGQEEVRQKDLAVTLKLDSVMRCASAAAGWPRAAVCAVGLLAGCTYPYTEVEGRGGWRAEKERTCMAARQPSPTITEIGPIVEEVTCGMDFPLEVTALSTGTVVISPTAKMSCPLADALENWITGSVQPAAMAQFGSPVVQITQISAYACRNRNNFGKELSEHAFGNALDISGFRIANGKSFSVQNGWKGDAKEQAFLRTVFAGACQRFTTSLGPGSNIMHYDHVHMDLAKLAPDGSLKMCKAGGVSGAAVAQDGHRATTDAADAAPPVPGNGTAVPGAD